VEPTRGGRDGARVTIAVTRAPGGFRVPERLLAAVALQEIHRVGGYFVASDKVVVLHGDLLDKSVISITSGDDLSVAIGWSFTIYR
jgi:isopentenyl phosphate kinase